MEIKIGNKIVGEGIYLILEIGRTYENDIEKAKEMIRKGAEAGADAIKIQSINPEGLLLFNEKNEEYFSKLKKLQRTREEHEILKKECEKYNVNFISTPETLEMVDLLDDVGIDAYKVSSLDLVYHKLITKIARKNKPIILSTGMSNQKEILETIELIKKEGNEKIILLHCVSLYPPEIEDLNLKMIKNIQKIGIISGFSDHTPDIESSLCAIGLGANVIEKHFKIDDPEESDWKGDYDVAITPKHVKKLKDFSKQMFDYSEEKIVNEKEVERRKIRGRKLIINRDVSIGEVLSEEDLDCKQNLELGGIDCVRLKDFIGKKMKKNKRKDQLLFEEDVE